MHLGFSAQLESQYVNVIQLSNSAIPFDYTYIYDSDDTINTCYSYR